MVLVFVRIPWLNSRRSRMSCSGHAMERYAGTLRAWHLAALRYAVRSRRCFSRHFGPGPRI